MRCLSFTILFTLPKYITIQYTTNILQGNNFRCVLYNVIVNNVVENASQICKNVSKIILKKINMLVKKILMHNLYDKYVYIL